MTNYKPLSEEETVELVAKMKAGDLAAKHTLILSLTGSIRGVELIYSLVNLGRVGQFGVTKFEIKI